MALRLRSPQEVLEMTRNYCEQRRARGFSVVVTTTLPRSGRIDPDDFEGAAGLERAPEVALAGVRRRAGRRGR